MFLIPTMSRREEDDYDNFNSEFNMKLAIESWTLFGVGAFLTLLRLYATTTRAGGPRNWLLDEYLILVAFSFYIMLVVTLNIIATNGGSNLFPPEQFSTFTEQEIKKRILNSKIVVVSEQAMLCTIYMLKACLLVMYTRLTTGLRTQKAVKALCVYAALGWLATEICFFTICIPFNQYWAILPTNDQCATLEYYGVVQGTFNISSDVLMLGIPISIVVRLQAPWRKKLVVGLVLTMGVFVIAAAIACKVHNLSNTYSSYYMFWYIREASVALYVANMPLIWPLLREWFPWLNRFGLSKSHSYLGASGYGVSGMTPNGLSSGKPGTGMRGSCLGTVTTSVYHQKRRADQNDLSDSTEDIVMQEMTTKRNTESQENILLPEAALRKNSVSVGGGIKVQQEVIVEQSHRTTKMMNEGAHGLEFDFDGALASKPRSHIDS